MANDDRLFLILNFNLDHLLDRLIDLIFEFLLKVGHTIIMQEHVR